MTKTRVLVVEDSITVRKRIVETLSADPDLEVIAEAGDGKTGIELCESLRPDVVTLDMMLPVMTGLAATEYIMAYCPTPIVIVSASVNRGELFRTYEALAAGAVDVVDKPHGDETDDEWERKLRSSVKIVSRIKVITHLRARLRPHGQTLARPLPRTQASSDDRIRVIAVGASTGGPGALRDLFRGIPDGFTHPILLVLHLGESFSTAFPEWLDGQSHLRVAYARDGEPVPGVGEGRVIMAPPGRHLVVEAGKLRLTRDPERHSCRPSVDTLFESVAREYGRAAGACLLTGMGRDGAAGLLSIRNAGGRTIAQDEASSVIFGMPREAILLGAAEQVLPLDEIARALAGWAHSAAPGKNP